MSPEAEAHKMIAISLGKIANSRIQRGGPKLFKNLLVANLIQKARVLMVEEPQSQETSNYECSTERYDCEPLESDIDVGSEHPNEFADEILVKPSTTDPTPKLGLGEESTTQQGYCDTQSQEGKHLKFENSEWDENNKENRPTNQDDINASVSFKLDIGLTNSATENPKALSDTITAVQMVSEPINNISEQECTKCNVPLRCLKRRNETTAENESSSFNQKRYRSADLLNTKRWRRAPILENQLGLSDVESDFEESSEFKYPSKVHILLSVELHCESELGSSNLSTEYTPMESEQMSSLASVFSSSFHGLGGRPNDRKKSISFDLCTSDGTYHVDSTGLSKTNSNSDMVVCSKQAASVLKVSFPGNKPVAVLV